jgi:hypothetical protein
MTAGYSTKSQLCAEREPGVEEKGATVLYRTGRQPLLGRRPQLRLVSGLANDPNLRRFSSDSGSSSSSFLPYLSDPLYDCPSQ